MLKQNDFWANSLPYAYRHVTRKHHVCGGNTEGAWTCIHQGEWLRCAMTNKQRDSPVPPLISPHDNNFKFTEIAETGSQDSRHILILIRGSVQSPKHISAVVRVEIQQPKACYPFHHVSISLCSPQKLFFSSFASFVSMSCFVCFSVSWVIRPALLSEPGLRGNKQHSERERQEPH